MEERPILFSGEMVRALLAGTKTQTRRVFKARNGGVWPNLNDKPGMVQILRNSPYGQPVDRLWVREAFRPIYPQQASYNGGRPIEFDYREGYQIGYRLGDTISPPKWKPGIHMPREACRIVLEVVSVRLERLQSISHDDACAEGIESQRGGAAACIQRYQDLWESINGAGSWAANPWVWVIEFKRAE